ncbi:MAG: 4Fe-4S dicluster domain-containing protein [Desulforhopalus sp.]
MKTAIKTMQKRLVIDFDSKLCSGCMACVVACRDQNDLHAGGVTFRTVSRHEQGPYPAIVIFRSTACLNCRKASCLQICPTGALFRHTDDGVVDVDRSLCTGCLSCAEVCPVGAPKLADDGKMAKCDLCRIRVRHGMEPACVHTCTTGALSFKMKYA